MIRMKSRDEYMPKTVKPALSDIDIIDIKELENADFDLRFEVTTLKLHECAQHVPGNDLDKDKEITALENQLLSLQEDLLEKTVTLNIKTDADFKIAKNIWKLAKGLKFDADPKLLDRLALSLFQYSDLRT